MIALLFKNVAKEAAVVEIAQKLEERLKEGSVLLSLSGGSAILPQIAILKHLKNLAGLTLTLNDERYGPVGHADSNWQQLINAGLNEIEAVKYTPLSGMDERQTTQGFNDFLSNYRRYHSLVSILGMGDDGHTSGLLPFCAAISSNNMAEYYEGPDYKRLTNTPAFLGLQDEIFVLAYGPAKHSQIDKLTMNIPISEQPIQIIKQVSRATFYNDYKGDNDEDSD